MNPFLDWNAYTKVTEAMSAKGFLVPRMYRDFVSNYCPGALSNNLNVYWEEVAREYASSGARRDSWARSFKVHSYRSQYLDELAGSFATLDNPCGVKILHPCLVKFNNQCFLDKLLWASLLGDIRERKIAEIASLSVTSPDWSGNKRDLVAPFARIAKTMGFNEDRGNWQTRYYGSFLVRTRVDVGGNARAVSVLPLEANAMQKDRPESLFNVTLDLIVPGFEQYERFVSPEEAFLGIAAHYACLDAFGQSLRDL